MAIVKNNNSNSEFGQRLSELLKSSNVSQRELAHKIGITEAAISRYINSDRTPNGKIIGSIAKAMHVSTDYLIYGHDDNTANADWIKKNAYQLPFEQKRELILLLLTEENGK